MPFTTADAPMTATGFLALAASAGLALLLAWLSGRRRRRRLVEQLGAMAAEARAARLALEAMDHGLLLLDQAHRCLYINPAGARLLGGRPREILRRPMHDLLAAPGREGRPAREAVEPWETPPDHGPSSRRAERYLRRLDGSLFLAEYGCRRLEEPGGPAHLLLWFSDITERKREETALRETDLRFRSVLLSAIDAVVLADGDGNIICWNPGAERMFGYKEDEILGRPLTHLMPERYRRPHEEGLARLHETGASRVIGRVLDLSGLRKDGREFPIELSLGTWTAGGRLFFTGIIRDITQRKLAEDSLRQRERELCRIGEERERLARDLHDGIIQSIYAIGLTLVESRRLMTEAPQRAQAMLDAVVADLNGVIRDVRSYLPGLTLKRAAAPDFHAGLARLLKTMNGTPGLRFASEIEERAAARVTAEQGQHLLHIVREAMSNSLRHSRASSGFVSLKRDGDGVRLEVRDDGVGFDQAARPEHGQGLRNMQARAVKLGARLEIRSSPGGGTSISLSLPPGGGHGDG